MRTVISGVAGQAEEELIAELWATTTTPPGAALAPFRADSEVH
ncbi:hypothetical protein BKA01_008441 [Pseudonocardia eucalypti]|nr:hypothetical protein [Pseudonocardia eucalypti]